MKNNLERGITLIALVITIIVLLILAGVAVSISFSSNSVFDRANEAKIGWNQKVNEENTIANGYLGQLDQYLNDDEPATGSLEINYDFICDTDNTYKVIKLAISGLKEKEQDQIINELVTVWDDGSTYEDIIGWIEEQVESGYYSNFKQGLWDYAYGDVDVYEPVTITVKLNGNTIQLDEDYKSFINQDDDYNFLATHNGTYTVTARSKSNRVGTANIVLDETKIGKTKEALGINEETFATPISSDYTDKNNKYAKIPSGYYVGTSDSINTVANGLVITSSIDGNGHSTGDEYVWIPIEDINNMVMCKTCGASGHLDTTSVQCSVHGANTQLAGKQYVTLNNGEFNANATGQSWITQSFHEPDIVSEYDKDDAVSGNNYMEKAGITDKTVTSFKNQLEEDFEKMAKSVAQYKGFWIARYETGTAGESKKGQTVVTAYDNNNMWYGLYNLSRHIDSSKNIAKTMIWGSQYDQVIKFIGSEAQTGNTNRNLKNYACKSAYTPLDKMKNIFDLEGNLFEWTSSVYNTNVRDLRGAGYICPGTKPASARWADEPYGQYEYNTSRITLYVTL